MVESKKDEKEDEDQSEVPTLELDLGWEDWGDEPKTKPAQGEEPVVNERPTLVPAFDVEAFARENANSKAGAALKTTPQMTPRSAAGVARVPPPVPSDPSPRPPPASASQAAQPFSQPFSQRETPARGIPTPVQVAQVSSREREVASRSRSERPTTLRVDQETLLALANKVAGSYVPAPAYDDPLPDPRTPTAAVARPDPHRAQTPVGSPIVEVGEDEAPAELIEDDPSAEMRDRFALGDYSGALVMAESLLEENPTLGEALEYAESCRQMLTQMYTSRIGPLDRVPLVEVQRDQLRWLSLDHRSGFVLSLVDGVSNLEMILDVSGMRELDALRILFELVQQRIISFR